jgi:hypothetical protein
MARSSTSISGLHQQLRALKNRVTWLERALKPVKKPISADLAHARDQAEEKARDEAMREFHQWEQIELYKRHPEWVEIAENRERKMNEFLRSRGLQPEPSSIPTEARPRKG